MEYSDVSWDIYLIGTKKYQKKLFVNMLNVAVEGCCHGELDTIYSNIKDYEIRTNRIVDLLLICGDFECVRDKIDLECLGITFLSIYCCKVSSLS